MVRYLDKAGSDEADSGRREEGVGSGGTDSGRTRAFCVS